MEGGAHAGLSEQAGWSRSLSLPHWGPPCSLGAGTPPWLLSISPCLNVAEKHSLPLAILPSVAGKSTVAGVGLPVQSWQLFSKSWPPREKSSMSLLPELSPAKVTEIAVASVHQERPPCEIPRCIGTGPLRGRCSGGRCQLCCQEVLELGSELRSSNRSHPFTCCP